MSDSSQLIVDRENPWLGLASFTEDSRAYFHGREAEVNELARRVQRKLLTVLFGQSGSGKTSLLRAGVVPQLRAEGFCPVYVRIDYSREAADPGAQVRQALARAVEGKGRWTASPDPESEESLWELFHVRGRSLRDATEKLLLPLLIFDQFEEVFTLAQSDGEGRERARSFLQQLGHLVENRPPEEVEARIEQDEAQAERFDFGRADYRVLLALREDYVAHLEGLKGDMPSITQNRMRLARMTGAQAVAAVTGPGGNLVKPEVAEAIVKFVSGARSVADAEVEPSLLSLVCRELNEARKVQRQGEISSTLLAGSRDTILAEFYERALADQPPGVRNAVEDVLLTESGYRESVAEERVRKEFAATGAAANAVETLVGRRLLRIEDRLDVRRIELTHDVLCGVVRASRNVRREREAKEAAEAQLAATQANEAAAQRALTRSRRLAAFGLSLAAIALLGAVFGYVNMRRAQAAEEKSHAAQELTDRARREADKLVAYLVDDLFEEIGPTGRVDIIEHVGVRTIAYYDSLPPEFRTPETVLNRSLALALSGEMLAAQGKRDEGRKMIEEAVRELEKLAEKKDASDRVIYSLAIALRASATSPLTDLKIALPTIRRARELLKPIASKPNATKRDRREYAKTLIGLLRFEPAAEAKAALLDEAKAVLVEAGALDLSDLTATGLYSHALSITTSIKRDSPDAERLNREALELAERVLEKRPGDLMALSTRGLAQFFLALVEVARNRHEAAIDRLTAAEKASQDFLRASPTLTSSWELLAVVRAQSGAVRMQTGKVEEALVNLQSALDLVRSKKVSARAIGAPELAFTIAEWEARRGNQKASETALETARELRAELQAGAGGKPASAVVWAEDGAARIRSIAWHLGRYEEVAKGAETSRPRCESLRGDGSLAVEEKPAVERLIKACDYDLGRALAMQERWSDAEGALRRSLPPLQTAEQKARKAGSEAPSRIWLALTLARQGRSEEARQIIDPSVDFLRSRLAAGDSRLQLRWNLAWALTMQAAAQDLGPEGAAQKREMLSDAEKMILTLPEQAKPLSDTRLVEQFIAAERSLTK